MSYRADKQVITAHTDGRTDGRTDTQTDAGNDNTQRPKLASGKNAEANQLVETGTKLMAEASHDLFGGSGVHITNESTLNMETWEEKNKVSQILMKIRNELQQGEGFIITYWVMNWSCITLMMLIRLGIQTPNALMMLTRLRGLMN